jgi:hypothetical protein
LARWRSPEMGVPLNHPIVDGFSIINNPAIGVPPYYGHPHNYIDVYIILIIVNHHQSSLTIDTFKPLKPIKTHLNLI